MSHVGQVWEQRLFVTTIFYVLCEGTEYEDGRPSYSLLNLETGHLDGVAQQALHNALTRVDSWWVRVL